MGYSKLSYDDIIEHPEVWRDEKELVSPAWAEEISELGYKGVWAVDFYNDVFGGHFLIYTSHTKEYKDFADIIYSIEGRNVKRDI